METKTFHDFGILNIVLSIGYVNFYPFEMNEQYFH